MGKKKDRIFHVLAICVLTGLFVWQYQMYQISDIPWQEAMAGKKEEGLNGARQSDDEKKQIALTFDDGPHPIYTQQLLQVLEEADVKASFFMMGKEAELYPDVVKKVSDAGHLIGNHTYSHVNVGNISHEEVLQEIRQTNDLLEELTGQCPQFFRPPFGCKNEVLEKQTGMFWIFWDVDTMDWSCQNADQIYEEVVKNVEENDIILMHDAYPSTVEAVRELIPALREMGYTFVTVDRLVEP